MTAFALPLAVIGGAYKIGSSYIAGKQNKKALYAQSREELAAGAAKELRIRETARKAIGEQVAAQFSNGFLGGTGSALEALTESQVNATLDALQVRREASARAQGLRSEGDMRARQGTLDAVGALVGTASAISGMQADWAAVRRPGG